MIDFPRDTQPYLAKPACEAVFKAFPDACFVIANGYVSREAFNVEDREGNFYMLGSMGLASAIGLGAAISCPEQKVVVLDGDGNLLMGLGALTMVGAQQPKNLYHVVLDNGVYASTGNQTTLAPQVDFGAVALGCGYQHAAEANDLESTERELETLAGLEGPVFLRIRIAPEGHPRTFARVTHTPAEISARFAGALAGSSA